MLIYFFVFALLGLFFPPFWILAFLFLLGSIFGDLGKILYMIIAFPFKLIGLMTDEEDEEVIHTKETIIKTNTDSNAEQLTQLSELLDKGHISEEEFQNEKSRIFTSS